MAGKKSSSSTSIMDVLSFVAVVVGGIALLVAFILGKVGISVTLVGILSKIANIIGWIVLCILSAKYIKTQSKVWMWVLWAIALVMIVVGIILG